MSLVYNLYNSGNKIPKNNINMKKITTKIACPYCGKEMEVDVPEPEESIIHEVNEICDNCRNKVIIPILPKIVIKPIELV